MIQVVAHLVEQRGDVAVVESVNDVVDLLRARSSQRVSWREAQAARTRCAITSLGDRDSAVAGDQPELPHPGEVVLDQW